MVEAFLPFLNNLLNINMVINYFNFYNWLGLIAIILITGLAAGSYPAFYLSSFEPIQTLRKKATGRAFLSISLRQVLIIGQFCFTVLLIISTLVIYKQIQYIKDRPLGADVNALIEMPQDGALQGKYELLKTRLVNSGAVSDMYQSSQSLVHHSSFFTNMEWPGSTPAELNVLFNRVGTTYDFIKTNGLKLTSGRDFSDKYASDTAAVLISRSAVKTMSLKEPLGTTIRFSGTTRKIIGVFEDYVWDSPYKSNTPLVVYFSKEHTGTVTMRLNTANSTQHNIELITKITKEINPAYPVELTFTNTVYEDLLAKERKLGVLSNVFGGLAVFVPVWDCTASLLLVPHNALRSLVSGKYWVHQLSI
ncbi:ABC transporter permease [Pedobacter sp. NJ-S-72]